MKKNGYSLLEVLVALVILNIGMSALFFAWDIHFKAKEKQSLKYLLRQKQISELELLRRSHQKLQDSTWIFETKNCEGDWMLDLFDAEDFSDLEDEFYWTEEQRSYYENRAQEGRLYPVFLEDKNCPAPDTLYFQREVF